MDFSLLFTGFIASFFYFFVPGYCASLAFSPNKSSEIERIAFSLAFGITLVPMIISLENFLGLPVNFFSAFLGIALVSVFSLALFALQRKEAFLDIKRGNYNALFPEQWDFDALWKEHRYFFLLSIPIILITFYATLQWSRPPGPLIGGDVYRFTGLAQGVRDGRSLLYNDPFKGEITYYAWLSNALFASLSHVSGLDIFGTFLLLIDISVIIACFTVYVAARKLFSEKAALLTFLLYFFLEGRLSESNPRDFALVIAPIFFLLFYEYYSSGKLSYLISSALTFGAMALYSNTFSGLLALPVFFPIVHYFRFKKAEWKRVILLIPPSLLFVLWFILPLYLQYNLRAVEVSTYYSTPDANPITKEIPAPPSLSSYLKDFFFNLGFPSGIISSAAFIYALYLILLSRKDEEVYGGAVLILGVLITISPSLTYPIFGEYIQHSADFIPTTFMASLSLSILLLSQTKPNRFRLLLAVLCLLSIYGRYGATFGNEWHAEMHHSALPLGLSSLREWVISNTKVTDVFAASPEISFLINGLTGRHILVTLYSHTNDFVPYLPRLGNNSVIFTSSSDTEAYQIAREWGVNYIVVSDAEISAYGEYAMKFANSSFFRPSGFPGIFEVV